MDDEEPAPEPEAPPVDRAQTICFGCLRGVRIDAPYALGGVVYPDGYCSWCGRRWP